MAGRLGVTLAFLVLGLAATADAGQQSPPASPPQAAQAVKAPANDGFVKQWSAYAKAKGIAGHKDKPLTNDPMEASYIGFNMWVQAVNKAKSTDTDKVIAAMAGQTWPAPGGFMSTMDKENHHLHKPVFIGEIKADGQFNVVWKTKGPVVADPWSDYIPENKGKKNVPEKK